MWSSCGLLFFASIYSFVSQAAVISPPRPISTMCAKATSRRAALTAAMLIRVRPRAGSKTEL